MYIPVFLPVKVPFSHCTGKEFKHNLSCLIHTNPSATARGAAREQRGTEGTGAWEKHPKWGISLL